MNRCAICGEYELAEHERTCWHDAALAVLRALAVPMKDNTTRYAHDSCVARLEESILLVTRNTDTYDHLFVRRFVRRCRCLGITLELRSPYQ